MSNAPKLKRLKQKLLRMNCPKCGKRAHGKEYSDAWLYICTSCKFPNRIPKP